jgi:predicted dithiol-disulfide oxidoreductase (DUF899 family)
MKIGTREEWLAARLDLLQREKELTRASDALARARQELPWVQVTEPYVFDTTDGERTFPELFGEHPQLLVYHLMMGPAWEDACSGCTYTGDTFDRAVEHLPHRDVGFVAISRAPVEAIEAYKARMGWSFDWVSSHGSDFNYDFGVSFTPDELASGQVDYNYRMQSFPAEEAPGVSVFYRDDAGDVFHTTTVASQPRPACWNTRFAARWSSISEATHCALNAASAGNKKPSRTGHGSFIAAARLARRSVRSDIHDPDGSR